MKICPVCKNSYVTGDNHHIVPQHLKGGKDLPTIDICSGCHQTLHRIVNDSHKCSEFLSTLDSSGRYIMEGLMEAIKKSEVILPKSDFITMNIKIERKIHDRLRYIKPINMTMSQLVQKILNKSVGII
jgi:hypothetical protein